MKLKLVADTSFLVSIGVSNQLGKLLSIADITATNIVKRELRSVAKYKDAEGRSAKFVLGKINKREISVEKAKPVVKGIGKGESSCLAIFKSGKFHFLCCDDVEALKKISNYIGPQSILLTFDVIRILVKRKLLNANEAKNVTKKLLRIRKWMLSGSMIKLAIKRGLV